MKKPAIIMIICISAIILAACGDSGTVPGNVNAGIDYDLTAMSDTVAITVARDIVTENPEAYIGDSISAKGGLASYWVEEIGQRVYYVEIYDSNLCCAVYIEFRAADNETEGYINSLGLADGDIITVTGVFGRYDAGEYGFMPYIELTELIQGE